MKKIITSVVILSAIVLAGCSASPQTANVRTVKIGVIAPLSGPGSTYGQDTATAIQISVDEFNKTHTGVQMEVVMEDGKCNGKDATSAAQKLINVDNVALLIGGVCSSEAVSVGKLAQENNIVSIVPLSQTTTLSTIGDHVFRYANGLHGGKMLADVINKHLSHVYLVSENTEFAQSMANVVRDNIGDRLAKDYTFESSEKDFGIIADNIDQYRGKVDGLVVITQAESNSINLIKALNKIHFQQNFTGKILAHTFFSSQTFLSGVGPQLADNLYNVYIDFDFSKDSLATKWMHQFNEKAQVRSFTAAPILTMEAMHVIGDAIAQGASTKDDFFNYFKAITKDHPKDGVFGSYYFSGSDAIEVPYYLQKIEKGIVKRITDF